MTKDVTNIYMKTTLQREITKILCKWTDLPSSWVRRLNISKTSSIISKLTYRFKAISIKILAGLFVESDKLILKFTEECKGSRLDKAAVGKKKSWIDTTNFETWHNTTITMIVRN